MSVFPCCGVPVITGRAVFTGGRAAGGGGGGGGGAAATMPVGLLVASVEPEAFVAVTVTRILLPTSPTPSVYCWPVLPPTEAQFAPAVSHRFHW